MFPDITNPTYVETTLKEETCAEHLGATLGKSNYPYAVAPLSHALERWLATEAHRLAFFGGVVAEVVSDHSMSAATLASRDRLDVDTTHAAVAGIFTLQLNRTP